MGICLLVDNEIIFGIDMPPSEKMNLIEISLLFTTKGTLAKFSEKRMNSWPGTFLGVEKHLVCDPPIILWINAT